MSDHPTTLTEAERDRLDGSLADSGCHGFLGDHPDLYAVAEQIKADAYAAGLAARTPTATEDTEHVVTFTDSIWGLTWACTCGAIGGGATAPVKAAGLAHARSATGVTAGDDLRDRVTALADEWAGDDFDLSGPQRAAALRDALAASPAPVVSRPEAEDVARAYARGRVDGIEDCLPMLPEDDSGHLIATRDLYADRAASLATDPEAGGDS